MLLKLSLRNIRRSARDYAIYFVTLLFGVAVFYAFNSISSQQILFDIESAADADMFEATQGILNMFSVVIAFVLGFLIVYANRFLIKRRKHEFGIYLTLGMSPGEISRIVLYETVIVGFVSLAVGLACGILLAQALSFATAMLFELTMTNYQFVFSEGAFLATLGCFVLIYVVVAVFNLLTVSRFKLIDLLYASAKNERMVARNPWVCLVVFVISIGILAAAYWFLWQNGMQYLDDPQFMYATVLMLVGSLLFFWSLSGFVILVLQRMRGVYLRGLAMFTVRQIASKVNTAFLSLWAVCVMLFFSLTTFSTGMGLINAFTAEIDAAAPYDVSITANVYYSDLDTFVHPDSQSWTERTNAMRAEYPELFAEGEQYNWDIAARLQTAIPEWNDLFASAAQIDEWEVPGVTIQQIINDTGAKIDDTSASIGTDNISVTPLSQFNAALEMVGREPVELSDDQYLVVNNMAATQSVAEAIVKQNWQLDVLGHSLHPIDAINDLQLQNSSMKSTILFFIVPDAVVDDIKAQGSIPLMSTLNLAYTDTYKEKNGAVGDDMLWDVMAKALPVEGEPNAYDQELWPVTSFYTSYELHSQASGLRMMITYLALYIGFVLLVATAAVLAIQQLSEATDSRDRYHLLSELGCDARMLNQSLFVQVLVYFGAPLLLAVCHAGYVILVLSHTLFSAVGVPVTGPILMAGGFTLAIYGGYMIVTYFAARGIVKQAVKG